MILKFVLFSRVDTSDFQEEKGETVCDVTKGKWVYDESYPLYSAFTFPFIDEGFNCEANGILDKDYMKWRWKPQDCYIPRFNATNMLDITKEKGNYCFIFVDYKCTVDQILIN